MSKNYTSIIREWNEKIENNTLTKYEVVDMLKDFYSAKDNLCSARELKRLFNNFYNCASIIAQSFNCEEDQISFDSISTYEMYEKDYVVILGNLYLNCLNMGDTGLIKFVGGNTYFQSINPKESEIKYFCGDVHFGNGKMNLNSVNYFGKRVFIPYENTKLQHEFARNNINFEFEEGEMDY